MYSNQNNPIQTLTNPTQNDKILNNEKIISFCRGSSFFLVRILNHAQKNSRHNTNSCNNRIVFSN